MEYNKLGLLANKEAKKNSQEHLLFLTEKKQRWEGSRMQVLGNRSRQARYGLAGTPDSRSLTVYL